MSDNIHVAIRIRPLIKREIENNANILWNTKNSAVIYQKNSPTNEYCFDRVFDVDDGNSLIYQDLCAPIVQSVMEGFNGTIFAYGQTSSGKTHTMMGEYGIIPSAIHDIFDTINNMPEREFLLRVSYMEIYNENVLDLLSNENKNLKTLEDMDGVISIMGLMEEEIKSSEEVFQIMKKGEKRRRVGDTQMNERSSRSHAIFRMIVESRMRSNDEDSVVNVGQLNLVDLAGSERSGQMGISGERLKEGININKSLLMLTQVISQLSKGDKQQYVSYRDSKLTRILQNSLGGNARTVIICTVTPASVQETLSTLNFASRAKRIKNKPTANIISNDKALLKRYTNEIKKLSEKLEALQQQGECGKKEILEKELEEKNKQNENLKKQIQELKEKFVVSQLSPDCPNLIFNKKNRRETWCGGLFNRRASDFPFPTLKKSSLNSDVFLEKQDRMPSFVSPPLPDFEFAKENINVSIQTDEVFVPGDQVFFEDFYESSPNTLSIFDEIKMSEMKDFANVSIQVSQFLSPNDSILTEINDVHDKSVQIDSKTSVDCACQTETANNIETAIQMSEITSEDRPNINTTSSLVFEDMKAIIIAVENALATQEFLSEKIGVLDDEISNIDVNLCFEDSDVQNKVILEQVDHHFSTKYDSKIKYLETNIDNLKYKDETHVQEIQHLENLCAEKNKELEIILDKMSNIKQDLWTKDNELSEWRQKAAEKYDLYLESIKEKQHFQNLLQDAQNSIHSKEKIIKSLTEKITQSEADFNQVKTELLETIKSLTMSKEELAAEKANIVRHEQDKNILNDKISSLASQLETGAKCYDEIIEEMKTNNRKMISSTESRLKQFYEKQMVTMEEKHKQELMYETEKIHSQIEVQISNLNTEKVKLEEELCKANEILKRKEEEFNKLKNTTAELNLEKKTESLTDEKEKRYQNLVEKLQKKLEVSEKINQDLNIARRTNLESMQEKEKKTSLLEKVIKEKDHILKEYTSKFNTFKSEVEKEYRKLKSENEELKQLVKTDGHKTNPSKEIESSLVEKNMQINELQQMCKKYKDDNSTLLQKLSLCKIEIRRLHDLTNESKIGSDSTPNRASMSNVQLQALLQQKEAYISRLEKENKKYQDYLKSKGHHRNVDNVSSALNLKENTPSVPCSTPSSFNSEKNNIESSTPYGSSSKVTSSSAKPLSNLQYDSQNCRQQ